MKRTLILSILVSLLAVASFAKTQPKDQPNKEGDAKETPKAGESKYFKPESVTTKGSVTVEGARVDYDATCGTIIVHPRGWDDAAKADKDDKGTDKASSNPDAEASMFYVAYLKQGATATQRPVMFLFNGGPGSATVWLHMGAFGPRRVVTADDTHTPAAPYNIVNNDYSLLDVADLVFIDAPGTGFSRVEGDGADKAFYGVDVDAHAFAEFITAFLSKYGRWNSPKYIFGESYGTPRGAVLTNMLQDDYAVDINGLVMLSQILNFDLSVDGAEANPGMDLPYVVALPTYAASAWYHHKVAGNPAALQPFLEEVEAFATGEYATALVKGAQLPDDQRKAIAEKLHNYTGLPVAYILKANLRIDGGEFEKNLQDETDTTTGRLDTRFSGPTLDPLSKESEYDPQSAAISSAYVSAFNEYVRKSLNFGHDRTYKPFAQLWRKWNFSHTQPNGAGGEGAVVNTMPDLATAMKQNPGLKVLLTGGYYDVATPFFEGWYEMHHLAIPAKLQDNITYHYYESGHMVYAHQESLKAIHDDVAAFVRSTNNLGSTTSSTKKQR